jgi:hypothetical protein
LVLVSPLLLVTALLVATTSPGTTAVSVVGRNGCDSTRSNSAPWSDADAILRAHPDCASSA